MSPKQGGHAFIYSNFEEQTNGARNLWQLQMWAKLLNIKVAEPFAVDSMFGLKGALPNISQALRFSDYFDIEAWNSKVVVEYGGSPLVKWEDFLSKAPHKAIILCTVLRATNQSLIVSYGDEDVKKFIPRDDLIWLKNKFNVVKMLTYIRSQIACHAVTLEEFYSFVFGDLKSSEVTLIIVNWVGMGVQTARVEIKSKPSIESFLSSTRVAFVHKHSAVSPRLLPSQRVLNAYKIYVAKYLGDRKYVGVVFRTECVMYYHPGTLDAKRTHLFNCSKKLSNVLNKIRNKWDIFLACDLGPFGSQSDDYFKHDDKWLIPIRDQVLLDTYNGSSQMNQREERLIDAAGGIKDTGFIALLEKTIAAHANCIVLLGVTSSFIDSSAEAYISLHNKDNMCVVSICANAYHNSTGQIVSLNDIPDKFL